MMFEPGQLVLCVDDRIKHPDEPDMTMWVRIYGARRLNYHLRRGAIYTIREVWERGVLLEEDCRLSAEEIAEGWSINPWSFSRFRPLPDERLDIFRSMLEPQSDGLKKAEEAVARAKKDIDQLVALEGK